MFFTSWQIYITRSTSLEELIPVCENNNISLILGGVFNSGILINPTPESYFDYTKLDSSWFENLTKSLVRIPKDHESAEFWLNKANTIKNACESFQTTLKKAAIQFPFFNATVSSCILGMNSSNQVIENIEDYSRQQPSNFWKY